VEHANYLVDILGNTPHKHQICYSLNYLPFPSLIYNIGSLKAFSPIGMIGSSMIHGKFEGIVDE
jgi:hypothetical protein